MIESSQLPQKQVTASHVAVSPRIDAVLFDYGQVLSQGPNATAWARMRAITGGSPELFHEAYWKPRHDYDRGTLNGTAYWKQVARTVGHAGLSGAELEALYQADVALWTDLNEPMVTWAKELHRRRFRTGILSNIGDRMETGIRNSFEWIGAFHHCTWSHQLKLAKPEPAIYHHAALGLQTSPEHILFIDDREENIEAARAAGMVAVQYITHDAFIAEMHAAGLDALL